MRSVRDIGEAFRCAGLDQVMTPFRSANSDAVQRKRRRGAADPATDDEKLHRDFDRSVIKVARRLASMGSA